MILAYLEQVARKGKRRINRMIQKKKKKKKKKMIKKHQKRSIYLTWQSTSLKQLLKKNFQPTKENPSTD